MDCCKLKPGHCSRTVSSCPEDSLFTWQNMSEIEDHYTSSVNIAIYTKNVAKCTWVWCNILAWYKFDLKRVTHLRSLTKTWRPDSKCKAFLGKIFLSKRLILKRAEFFFFLFQVAFGWSVYCLASGIVYLFFCNARQNTGGAWKKEIKGWVVVNRSKKRIIWKMNWKSIIWRSLKVR